MRARRAGEVKHTARIPIGRDGATGRRSTPRTHGGSRGRRSRRPPPTANRRPGCVGKSCRITDGSIFAAIFATAFGAGNSKRFENSKENFDGSSISKDCRRQTGCLFSAGSFPSGSSRCLARALERRVRQTPWLSGSRRYGASPLYLAQPFSCAVERALEPAKSFSSDPLP